MFAYEPLISADDPNRDALDSFLNLQHNRTQESPRFTATRWDKRALLWQTEQVDRRRGDARVKSALRFLLERGILNADMAIADIGCGPARFAAAFSPYVREVVGFDVSEEMLKAGRAHLAQEGVKNVNLHLADFHTLDVGRAGYEKAFDLVFCSMTEAIEGERAIQNCIAMSRAWCLHISRIHSRNLLRERVLREVFQRDYISRQGGQGFYALFNLLFLLGYYPETSYERSWREHVITPTADYVTFFMEHSLREEEQTPENAKRILDWLKANAKPDGTVTEVTESCYARLLWDVRLRDGRPHYH